MGSTARACDFYNAGHGDRAKQQEIIDWFKRDYGKDITAEQTMCHGCHGPKEFHWSPNCKLMNCAEDKRVNICIECPEFICEKLDSFANDDSETHRRTVTNLLEMKRQGLQKWIREHKPVVCP